MATPSASTSNNTVIVGASFQSNNVVGAVVDHSASVQQNAEKESKESDNVLKALKEELSAAVDGKTNIRLVSILSNREINQHDKIDQYLSQIKSVLEEKKENKFCTADEWFKTRNKMKESTKRAHAMLHRMHFLKINPLHWTNGNLSTLAELMGCSDDICEYIKGLKIWNKLGISHPAQFVDAVVQNIDNDNLEQLDVLKMTELLLFYHQITRYVPEGPQIMNKQKNIK